jgi:hypothetical protein
VSDWYARRLARARSEAPAPRQQPQPQQYAPQYRQQQPPPGYNPQPAPQSVPTTIGNLWGQMQAWRGGPAHKVDANPCPQCGSDHYYSRTGAEVRRGPPPAPHCFDCGYNGMFEQGLASTWNG